MSAEDWMYAIRFIAGVIAWAFALVAVGHWYFKDEDDRADREGL